jgi:hypothetical protein
VSLPSAKPATGPWSEIGKPMASKFTFSSASRYFFVEHFTFNPSYYRAPNTLSKRQFNRVPGLDILHYLK